MNSKQVCAFGHVEAAYDPSTVLLPIRWWFNPYVVSVACLAPLSMGFSRQD